MNLSRFASRAGRVLADNSPAILTAVGVVGTVTTAFLAGKASIQAGRVIQVDLQNAHEGDIPPMSTRETIEKHWKLYIPAVATGAATVTCIVLANRIGTRRAAAMAAGYTILETGFSEYKAKVVEKIGEKKETEIRDEIAKDRINRNLPNENSVLVVEEGKQLCHDAFSDRYFMSSMERLRKAENDINKQIHSMNYATLSEFYSNIGLPDTSIAQEFGWNTDKWLSLGFTSVLVETGPYAGKTALSFDFRVVPVRSPWEFQGPGNPRGAV